MITFSINTMGSFYILCCSFTLYYTYVCLFDSTVTPSPTVTQSPVMMGGVNIAAAVAIPVVLVLLLLLIGVVMGVVIISQKKKG